MQKLVGSTTWHLPELTGRYPLRCGRRLWWCHICMQKVVGRTTWHLPKLTGELCFFVWALILLCCLRRCLRNAYAATVGAYAAHPFEGVPTQAQRPCKATPQCTFVPTPSHFRLLLEGWKRNFCLRDHSPIHIFAKWPYGTLHSLHQHERPGSKAPIDILQPHPCAAAAPATRSQSAH